MLKGSLLRLKPTDSNVQRAGCSQDWLPHSNLDLFVSQSDHGIDAGGAKGRQEACDDRYGREQSNRTGERQGIC